MTKLIDNTEMFDAATRIVGAASDLLEKLECDNPEPSPEKAKTLWAIKFIIETQSTAIRQLVEQHASICDQLNKLIETNLV